MKDRTTSRLPVFEPPDSLDITYRTRCFGCFRPVSECYCDAIPTIDNKTEFLIIQHVRERGHPFNTARMVHKALNRSKLFCGNNKALAKIKFPLRPGAGLLYPSSQAKTLTELPSNEKPEQLVLIDGTWSQARKIVRDLDQLKDLPHYKLAPTQPGQYRIRLEPTDTSLSTVEAAVESLREIEPETCGLDQLLRAFEQMVQRQLDHPRVGREHYSAGPKSGHTINIPHRLLGDADSIVVAYGEAAYREVGKIPRCPNQDKLARQPLRQFDEPRRPLVWVAKRLGTGETFSRSLTTDVPLTDSFLSHLELSRGNFDNSVSVSRFREEWRSFLRDGDTVVVYNQGTIRLLKNVEAEFQSCLTLKSIRYDMASRRRSLSQFVEQKELRCEESAPDQGRAGKRLANTMALVNYLREL